MKATIKLTGDVGEFDPVSLKNLVGQIQRNNTATEFDIILKSGGGEVYEGFKIRRYLQELNKTKKVNIIGSSIVASIATIIFLSVPRAQRFLENNCDFMIHLPSGGVDGNVDFILEYAGELDDIRNELIKIYNEDLGIDKMALSELLKSETWFNLQDCKDFGIASSYLAPQTNKIIINTNILKMRKDEKSGGSLKDTIAKIVNKAIGGNPPATKKPDAPKNTRRARRQRNETFTTAEGVLVDFPSLEAGQMPEAGDEATIDGQAATGEVVMANGETWIFDAGKFVAVKTESENAEDDATVAELEAEIVELEADLEDAEAEIDELEAELATNKAELAKAKADLETSKAEATKFKNALTEIEKQTNGNPPDVRPKNSTRGERRNSAAGDAPKARTIQRNKK